MSQVRLKLHTQRRRQDLPAVRLHDVIKKRHDKVSSVCNNDVPLVMKHPTTSPWYVTKTSWCYVSTESLRNVVTTSQEYVTTTYIGTPSRRLKLVSNERLNDTSVVHHQDISVVYLHDAAQERCSDVSKVSNHNVSSKSQMKHPVKLPWQVSTTFLNCVAITLY